MTVDTDGIPPGMNPMEVPYIGQHGIITFSGAFYALGGQVVEFARPVVMVTILRRVIVAQDTENFNIYVVDREAGISMGCLMKAKVSCGGEKL